MLEIEDEPNNWHNKEVEMTKPLVFGKLKDIPKIDVPDSVVGGKFVPYSMIGVCVLLLGYSLFGGGSKDEVEQEDEADEN